MSTQPSAAAKKQHNDDELPGGLSLYVWIGIGAGALVVVAVIVAGIVLLCRRKQGSKPPPTISYMTDVNVNNQQEISVNIYVANDDVTAASQAKQNGDVYPNASSRHDTSPPTPQKATQSPSRRPEDKVEQIVNSSDVNSKAEQPPDAMHAEPVQYAQVDVSLLPPSAATHQPVTAAPEEEHEALHYADLDLNTASQASAADDVTEQSPYAYAAHADVLRQPVKPVSGDAPYAYASHDNVAIQENGKTNDAINLSEMYAVPNKKPSLKAKPDGTETSATDVNKAHVDVSTTPTYSPNKADLAEMYAVPNKPSLKQKPPATTAERVDDVTATVDSKAADQVAAPDASSMYATPNKPSLMPMPHTLTYSDSQ